MRKREASLSSKTALRLAVALPLPAMLLLSFLAPVRAEIVSHAKVSYFTVEGSTPAEIYRNILDRGPLVNGSRALASITTQTTQDGDLDEQGGICRVTNYVITLDFTIQRPRIANEQVLPPADHALWQQMNTFIETHENQHKSVWSACAADLDAHIETLQAPTCEELGKNAEALWEDMLASCDKTQRHYDEEQSRALMKQPFMQRALQAAP